MNIEIERKFLVSGTGWKKSAEVKYVRQGYISISESHVVRVRIIENRGMITIKGLIKGTSRMEFEYPVPFVDAEELLQRFCKYPLIEKNRWFLTFKGSEWVVDEFLGANHGLIVAEIELESEVQDFEKPDWIDKEISDDVRYYNANLSRHPFTKWKH
jgi:adenylate cyclase